MLARARTAAPFATLQISDRGINFENNFDLIYAIAVFAHIKDNLIPALFENIYRHLKSEGMFVFFEQTGRCRLSGETWHRRTTWEYIRYAEDAGLNIEKRKLIAFPLHRIFERRLAHYYQRFFVKGADHHERCINANKSFLFKFMSNLALHLSKEPYRNDEGVIDGNTLYICRKSNPCDPNNV
jgi:SAM-dependent methyltransferase